MILTIFICDTYYFYLREEAQELPGGGAPSGLPLFTPPRSLHRRARYTATLIAPKPQQRARAGPYQGPRRLLSESLAAAVLVVGPVTASLTGWR